MTVCTITTPQKLIREATRDLLQELALNEVMAEPMEDGNSSSNEEDDLCMALFGTVPSKETHAHMVKDLKLAMHSEEGEGNFGEDEKFQMQFLIHAHEAMGHYMLASEFHAALNSGNDSMGAVHTSYFDDEMVDDERDKSVSVSVACARSLKDATEEYVKGREMMLPFLAAGDEEGKSTSSSKNILIVRKILRLISVKLRRCRVELTAWARKVVHSNIKIQSSCLDVMHSGTSLSDAFEVLLLMKMNESDGMMGSWVNDTLKTIASNICELAIYPIMDFYEINTYTAYNSNSVEGPSALIQGLARNKSSPNWKLFHASLWTVKVSSQKASAKKIQHLLRWERDISSTLKAENDYSEVSGSNNQSDTLLAVDCLKEITKNITVILEFLVKNVLLDNSNLCSIFGHFLFDEGSQLLPKILNLVYEVIPTNHSQLPSVVSLVPSVVLEFQERIAQMKLLSEKDNCISGAIIDMEKCYAEKRRVNILTEGHSILAKDYQNSVQVGNAPARTVITDEIDVTHREDPFSFAYCSISIVAQDLLRLCRNTLEEATMVEMDQSRDSETALTPFLLFKTSRELFDMFRAVISSRHGISIANIPRCAAIFHNDCDYIAFNLLTLGLEFGPKFRHENLRRMCTFVDMVPIFRRLAEEKLGDVVNIQKGELIKIMEDRMDGLWHSLALDEVGGGKIWSESENAVNGAVNHAQQVSQAWGPILATNIYCKAMGMLIDCIFELILSHVMKAPDISESSCQFVNTLFGDLLGSVEECFPKRVAEAQISCKYWHRFFAVGKFMNMSLSEINHALAQGFFRSITGPELSSLIQSTFAESTKRENVLEALSKSDQM